MTIIEKIKQSVEGATGMPFLYHAAGELNELIARCRELPVAYSFLIDSGTIDDVNGRYHERVTIAVMFCDKTQFDFNAIENEEIIDRMKVKAYKWLNSLRMSNTLRIVSVNNTQRLYDNTTDILTGFAVNITIEDVAGAGECELPEVVIDVNKNGSYDVVGVDKVRVHVVPKLDELEVSQNGEYLPPTDIAGFSKVSVDVQQVLEELTITQNGEYTPQEGVDGFSKVVAEFDPSSLPKVKIASGFTITACCIENGKWDGLKRLDTSCATNIKITFDDKNAQADDIVILEPIDTSSATSMSLSFRGKGGALYCRDLKFKGSSLYNLCNQAQIKNIYLSGWDTDTITDARKLFYNNYFVEYIDLTGWTLRNAINIDSIFGGYGYYNDKGFEIGGNLADLTIENATVISNAFDFPKIKMLDLRKTKLSKVTTNASNYIVRAPRLVSLVGYDTIESVIENNYTVFKDMKLSYGISAKSLDRASLRAVINGLADLTGQTAQTLTLGATLLAKLTEEDIAIATNKNWTIA